MSQFPAPLTHPAHRDTSIGMRGSSSEGGLPPSARIDLLAGMLGMLEDATFAGRTYLMAKVVLVLRREALDPCVSLTLMEREIVMRRLADLEREAGRVAPEPQTFDRQARTLAQILLVA